MLNRILVKKAKERYTDKVFVSLQTSEEYVVIFPD